MVLAGGNVAFQLARGATLSAAFDDAFVMIVVAAATLGLRIATLVMLPRQVRRMMSQHPTMGEPIDCRWSTNGVFFAGSNGTANLPWARLHRWMEDESSFIFLQTDRLM